MMPPSVIRVRVVEQGRKLAGVWVPLFLIWPFVLLLLLLVLPLAIVAEVVLRLCGEKWSPLALMLGVVRLLFAMSGMQVDVSSRSREKQTEVRVLFR